MLDHLKILARHAAKQRGITIIKMMGLILGMLSSLFILEYVVYQRSFDKGHGEGIYRFAYNRYGKEGLMWRTANFFVPAGPYVESKYPEVESSASLWRAYDITLTYKDDFGNNIVWNVEKSYYATQSLFSMYRYPVLLGDINSLEKPYTVAVSQSAARQIFGDADPIGRTLKLNHDDVFTVSAIFKDLPPNSHLKSDFFFSFSTFLAQNPWIVNNWYADGAYVYIKLNPGVDYLKFQEKVARDMIADNYAEQQKSQNQRDEIFLQSVRSIHLYSNLEYEMEPPGNGKAVTLLFVFSIFFLVIAWINFINLESAKSLERAKEIGIKRANGSSRALLVKQFITEAITFNLICYLITIFLFVTIDPYYRHATGIPADVKVFDPAFWIVFSMVVVAGITISALYPAFILSSFKPVEVLRGRFVSSSHSYFMRKALVTFQFILSIVFISATIVTYKQVDYLIKKDFGISYHSKMVIKAPQRAAYGNAFSSKMESLFDKIAQDPNIYNFTFCSDIPGKEIFGFFGGYPKGQTENELNWFFGIHADHRFASSFDAKVLVGRTFRENDHPEARRLIINEAALKRFGFPDPDSAVDQLVIGHDKREWQIIGVYRDFHYYSVKVAPVPTCFTNQEYQRRYLVLNINNHGEGNEMLISSLKNTYQEIFPDQPFDFFFLEDLVMTNLKPDKTFVSVFGVFSLLALIIALMGIMGLLLIFTIQNMKEFGIRKVMGAGMLSIFGNLARQFALQMGIAILVGVPLAVYGLNRWMTQNYISYIELKAIYFIIPVIVVVVSLIYVLAWATLKTFRMNVIHVINYE